MLKIVFPDELFHGSLRIPSPNRAKNPSSGSVACAVGSFNASIKAACKASSLFCSKT